MTTSETKPQKSTIDSDPFALLTDSQWRFVTAMIDNPSFSKADAARAVGLRPNTVYGWPGSVDTAIEEARKDMHRAALTVRQKALLKAMRVKLALLDHKDAKLRDKVATDLIEWELGKASQPIAGQAGESGNGINATQEGKKTLVFPIDEIGPAFLDVYDDVKERRHTEYVLYGGRGSTKSSFIGLIIVWLIVNIPDAHAVVMRRVKHTLRDSVYSQIVWAIAQLGVEDKFKCTISPQEITHISTGQKIYFRGADEPGKLKSIKPTFGAIKILWLEELDQFDGPEAVRNIEQSAIRGTDEAFIFKSFNPPRSTSNWANKYVQIPKENQYRHRSTYLDLRGRMRWLGRVFIDEAEHLQSVNPKAYEHEYLGVPIGTGGAVFENVELREITPEEIARFDRLHHGLDWGYFPDPAAYNLMHYDAARLTLYIFREFRGHKLANRDLHQKLVETGLAPNDLVIADSAEPKSIADFVSYGQKCRGAEKGPDSVSYSMKWLQSLRSIVIDPARCPFTAQEFTQYELEQDKDGNLISKYPDYDNHHIDAVRYATNLIWRRRGQ